MTKGRSLKQSLGMLCGVIAAACAVLYSITLVYVLETAESKLMASVDGRYAADCCDCRYPAGEAAAS